MSRIVIVVAFSIAQLAAAGQALAGEALIADLVRGHALARAHCAVCHAVGASDESPTRANLNTSFRQLPERFPIPMLEEAARSGVISGHDEMPAFKFSPDDMRALLGYIDSFAPDSAHYIEQPKKR